VQVIYADTIFVINTVINYLLLLVTAKICAAQCPRLRMVTAAALGGVYAVVSALPAAQFLRNPLVIIAVGLLIVVAAFGSQPRIIRLTLVFFAVSAAFAGAALAVALLAGGQGRGSMMPPVSIKALVLSFGASYAVLSMVFRRTAANRGGIVTLTVRQGSSVVKLRALVDTGNCIVDPMTGRPVIVVGVCDAKKLLPKEVRAAVEQVERRGAAPVMEELVRIGGPVRFMLIPYSAVGVSGGVLLAFRPDEVTVNGDAKPGMILALSPNCVSDNGTYSALIGA